MKNQNGFTLIELVVVIVILGILAAVAVPKFVDMQVDARVATVSGLFGAVQSASAMSHAKALVEGDDMSAETGQSVIIEGSTINLTYGYPAAASIDDAVNIDGFSFSASGSTGTFSLENGPANCTVTYQAATSGGVPTITNNADSTNCR